MLKRLIIIDLVKNLRVMAIKRNFGKYLLEVIFKDLKEKMLKYLNISRLWVKFKNMKNKTIELLLKLYKNRKDFKNNFKNLNYKK